MADSLTTERGLDHQIMWRYLRQLLDRVGTVVDDEVSNECVDIIVDLLGADRGFVLLRSTDRTTRVVNARANSKVLEATEREEISRTIVREALESGTLARWNQLESVTSSASIRHLGIVASMAAPIPGRAGGPPRGVLYVDFRKRARVLTILHGEFLQASAVVMGTLLDQLDSARIAREHLVEAKANCVESRRTPPLDELLDYESLRHSRDEIASAIASEAPILILGESGTGKTLMAQAIAEASGRRPIVRAVLGMSDDLNTITSELFGHERAAFSGAVGKRVGLVEYADNGTLILDELLNLPPHAQKLLLDFTQFGRYRPLGHSRAEPKSARIRIIAATNGDLDLAMQTGRFREDLYHRLAAVVLHLPPLRDRRHDIPALAERTLRAADPTREWSLTVPLRQLLLTPTLAWSGNIRQLEQVILRARERALLKDPNASTLDPRHVEPRDLDRKALDLPARPAGTAEPPVNGDGSIAAKWESLQADQARIKAHEEDLLREALLRHDSVIAKVARELGIARTTLASRLEALGIRPVRRTE
jgi:DNA-binding NtrC family response regulator